MKANSSPLITVIVPCYNYGNFISECLQSIIGQTYSNWECIVVDNGSTDNSKEVVKAMCAKDARIIYEFTEQKGVSFARNHAVKLSKGSYILPVDADDKIDSTYMEKALKFMEADPKLKVVYCDANLFGDSSGEWILPAFSLRNLLVENSIFCTGLFRKTDFERIGGYSEDMKEGFEDWDFWIRMLKDGGEVHKIPETLFYYRIKANSRNSVLDNEKQLMLRRKIFENHKELYEKTYKMPDLIFHHYILNKEIKSLRNSKDYQFGKMLLAPLRGIKKLISGKNQ